MDVSNITLRLGQMLLVQTASEMLTGTLKFVDTQRKIIELDNAYDQCARYQYTSPQILAIPQIKKLQIIHNDTEMPSSSSEATTSTSETEPDSASFQNSSASSPQQQNMRQQKDNDSSFLSLSISELQLAHEQLNTISCITQTDQRYHKALADIRVQPVVALYMEPIEYGRVKRTSVMVVATFHTVYIFDIVALGSIFREMKQLLEAERPRKAVHYSHKLADHLKHRHNVELGGIFDTFVAYSLIRATKEPISLVKTVEHTLGISAMYFQHEELENRAYDPFKRPLTADMRQVYAKKAIFQLKLYEHLLHKHMLDSFYQQCANFAQTFSNNSDATTPMEMQPKSHAGFQHIKRNFMAFSHKFDELE